MPVDWLDNKLVKSDLIFDIHTGHCRISEERLRDARPPLSLLYWILTHTLMPCGVLCTAKNQYRKFETNIPRKGIVRPQSHFHIHVSVSDLHIPTINLVMEYGNWD
jgi:hypothetical protein